MSASSGSYRIDMLLVGDDEQQVRFRNRRFQGWRASGQKSARGKTYRTGSAGFEKCSPARGFHS